MVDDKQVVFAIEGKARWAIDFTVAAPRGAPLGHVAAFPVVHRNTLQAIVGEVQVPLAVECESARGRHLTVSPAVAADMRKELVLQTHDLDADDAKRLGVTTARDVDLSVAPYRHVDRQMKPSAALVGGEAYRIHVFQCERLSSRLCSHSRFPARPARRAGTPAW